MRQAPGEEFDHEEGFRTHIPGACVQVSDGLRVGRPFPERVMDEVSKESVRLWEVRTKAKM